MFRVKKPLVFILSFCMLIMILFGVVNPVSVYAEAEPNLLANPGFESGNTGWANMPNAFTVVGTEYRSGANGMKLTPVLNNGNIKQTLNVSANTKYILQFWGKIASGGPAVKVVDQTNGGTAFPTVNNPRLISNSGVAATNLNKWKSYQYYFTTASNTAQIVLYVNDATNSGNYGVSGDPSYYDDFVLTVAPSSISFADGSYSVPAGKTVQLCVNADYPDANSGDITGGAKYSSSDTSKATVDDNGVVTGKATGSATITATYGDLTNTVVVDVTEPVLDSISLDSGEYSIMRGGTHNTIVTGHYSDGSTADVTASATFSSDNTDCVTVGAISGVVTGLEYGSAVVTATYDGKSAAANVTVAPPALQSISLDTDFISLTKGDTHSLTVIAHYTDTSSADVTSMSAYLSSDTDVVSISTSGAISAIGPGTATITASYEGQTAVASVNVTRMQTYFVTRQGDKLMLNGSEFRFFGANAYGLSYDENPNRHNPSEFEVLDWFKTFNEMGFNVIRFFPSCQGDALTLEPSLGVWNEDAWKKLDYVVKTANDYGIRLIMPLIDNYQYYHGGKHVFTDWRGVPESDFYTNPVVIGDFEAFVSHLLNRVNTYTGVKYKDDPTILAWETGNELQAVPSWTSMIAAYLKSEDSKHLVIDGNYGIVPNSLTDPNVDIVSNHYYRTDAAGFKSKTDADRNQAKGKKVLINGEFGDLLTNPAYDRNSAFQGLIDAVYENGTSGMLVWSLFAHDDAGGFTQHGDGYALRFPGDDAYMRTTMEILRNGAYKMRGLTVPARNIPGAPFILSAVSDDTGITLKWNGSAGADSYNVERAESPEGPWTTIATDVIDNEIPYTGYTDSTAVTGRDYYYRMRAVNISGTSDASAPVGPVQYASSQDAVNLVSNGGFETGDGTSWMLGPHWNATSAGAVYTGSYAVQVAGTGDYCCLQQVVTVTPNTNYTFSFYAKVDKAAKFKILDPGNGDATIAESQLSITPDWTKFKLSFNSGNRTAVKLYIGDGGENGFFDDFALTQSNGIVTPAGKVGLSQYNLNFKIGEMQKVTATVTDISNTTAAGAEMVWSTDDSSVAAVTPDGNSAKITAVSGGSTVVKATFGNYQEALLTVNVMQPSKVALSVDKSRLTVGDPVNGQVPLTITASMDDGSVVDISGADIVFNSTDPSVADVESNNIVAKSAGTATINATLTLAGGLEIQSNGLVINVYDGITPVSVSVSPSAITLVQGQSLTVAASVLDQDEKPIPELKVTWHSDKPAIATVDESGKIKAVGAGVANITAKYGELTSLQINVKVQLAVIKKTLTVDGNLDELADCDSIDLAATGNVMETPYDGAEDLSGNIWTTWDDNNLYIAARIHDSVHNQTNTGSNIWQGDSVQFALYPGAPGTSSNYYEYGMALTPSGPQLFRWTNAVTNGPTGLVDDAQIVFTRDEANKDTIYEVSLPWNSDLSVIDKDQMFSYSIAINDNDGSGRKGWVEWGGGVGGSKDLSLFMPAKFVTSESEPGSGDTGSGDSGSGDTGSGDTGSGDSGSGDSGSGDTGSGDTGSGDLGSGDSGSAVNPPAAKPAQKLTDALAKLNDNAASVGNSIDGIIQELGKLGAGDITADMKNQLSKAADTIVKLIAKVADTAIDVKVQGNAMTAQVDNQAILDQVSAITKAAQLADKLASVGVSNAGLKKSSISIVVPQNTGKTDVSVLLPVKAVKSIKDSGLAVEIDNGLAAFKLPAEALQTIMNSSGNATNVEISVKKADNTAAGALNNAEALKTLELSITSTAADGTREKPKSDFAKKITVTIPVDGSYTGKLVIYRQKDDGSWEYMGGNLSADKKSISFDTEHTSLYTLAQFTKVFTDVKGHWAENVIYEMAARSIADGMTKTTFAPDSNVTRAQFVALVVKTLNLGAKKPAKQTFSDVNPSYWGYSEIETAYANGLIAGKGNGRFAPEASITREEMASILQKLGGIKVSLTDARKNELLNKFKDGGKVTGWAKDAIAACIQNGLIEGMNGMIAPKAIATRAQAVVVLKRVLDILENQ